MFGLGPMELGIIVVLVVLLFGPSQLPKLGRAFGETRKAVRDIQKEMEQN